MAGGPPPGLLLGLGRDGGIGIGHAGQVTVFQAMPPPPARSAYSRQVERIAPPDPPGLRDRDAELAELARFCLDSPGTSYVWWRAGPWAGKSALLSTFVLRPPREVAGHAWFVSFFITARLAGQDTRQAFTEVVLEQLAALLGQSLPPVLPEATREAYLLDLMAQAATACSGAGGRLVLVVDGLDEDRGLTTGPGAHSIAGLLPSHPPAGMRVIVASRPDPPVPDDVPEWHPLRDPGIIRPLPPSRHAQAMKRLARQELRRLLGGSPAERDLLGLVTAARGGLTASDLAELAGIPLWEVEKILLATAGRMFRRLPGRYDLQADPGRYLLGHEELQAAATDYLAGHLAGYRERLHSWADGYRARRWPPETPEYLLTSYFRLLEDLGDLPRMTQCALDPVRHDRMLDLTGGDAAALTEARTVLDRIAAQDEPDLASALVLACHRDHLADRNARMPLSLPAVWASLGQLPRAQALARSLKGPESQAAAEAKIAAALAQAGQYQQVETMARSITNPYDQATALAEVARALALAGQLHQAAAIAEQAESVARSVTNDPRKATALTLAAGALALAGQHQQAEDLARSITNPYDQALALAEVGGALALGGHQQAAAITAQAETTARSISSDARRAVALAKVAGALALAGQQQQAGAITAQAGTIAGSEDVLQSETLAEVTGMVALAGQYQQAEDLARSITHPYFQALALAEVARALALAGQNQRAAAIAEQAETVARSVTLPYWQPGALTEIAGALALAGQDQWAAAVAARAEAMARSMPFPDQQPGAVAQVAKVLAMAGQHSRAAAVAARAETVALSIIDPFYQATALVEVAGALVLSGRHQQAAAIASAAQTVARSVTREGRQERVLAEVVEVLAQAGQYQEAEALARSMRQRTDHGRTIGLHIRSASARAKVAEALAQAGQYQRAEDLARSIILPDQQVSALAKVAEALAQGGQYRQAEDLARSITHPLHQETSDQVTAQAKVARALALAGQHEQAAAIAARAETVARSITKPFYQALALAEVAGALALARQYQQAEDLAGLITDPLHQALALAEVAGALALDGRHQQAAAIATQAEAMARSITDPSRQEALSYQVTALAKAARVLAWAGRHQQAAAIATQAQTTARSITDPGRQASALAEIAGALEEAGEGRSAARVTAVLCTIGRWSAAMAPVLMLVPSALPALADMLEEQQSAGTVS